MKWEKIAMKTNREKEEIIIVFDYFMENIIKIILSPIAN